MRVAEPRDLDDGTRMRAPLPEPGEGADRTFVPDRRGLDGIALPHHSQQGDDAVMGEIDLLDGFSLFLQDHPLIEDDLLQIGGKRSKIPWGETRQQQVAPAGMGAIQLHVCPLMAELDTAPKCNSAPATRPLPPATLVSHQYGTCLCGIRQRCCGREIRANTLAATAQ